VTAGGGARYERGMRSLPAAAVLATASLACGASAPTAEYLTPYGPSTLPFSSAVRVGDVIYVSGQIGNVPGDTSGVVPGGIEAETKRALENVRDVLENSGSSMDRVFKCTVMMADMKDWPAMNAVYASFFGAHKPARSSFGTTGLALGAKVEIECAALR
jgi:2-iminobutanoate/2-iminopropanoate deaminase